MTTELECLVAVALWGFILVGIEAAAKTRTAGMEWSIGNRDAAPPFPAWVQRVGRALANHKENFPLFATAILVVTLTAHTNRVTAWAAIAFVAARVLHGLVYLAGITRLRTAIWLASVAATLAIYAQLLS